MSGKSDGQANFAFDDVLETTSSLKKKPVAPSRVQTLLNSMDWNAYKRKVVVAVAEAVARYQAQFSQQPEEKVFQISIWTDPQARKTAINFETKQHALEAIQKNLEYHQKRGISSGTLDSQAQRYNANPADFKHRECHTIVHPELSNLAELDFNKKSHSRLADSYIERALLEVMDRILQEGLLDKLPRESKIWIGVSSPRDWYDHVRLV